MSIGNTFGTGGEYYGNTAVDKLTNLFSDKVKQTKDEMFAELHGVDKYDYDARDYFRYGFENKDDMEEFASAMRSEGLEVAITNNKYNGQYLVEIAKEQEDGRKAVDYIDNYENTTGYQLEQPKDEVYMNTNYHNGLRESLAHEVFTKNMDGWQETFGTMSSIMHWASGGKYEDDKNGTDLFKHKANNNGEISTSAKVGDNSQRAIVLNNDTVIINGEIVTDEKIRDNVLKQHQQRTDYINNDNNAKDEFSDAMRNKRRENRCASNVADELNDLAKEVNTLKLKEFTDGLSDKEQLRLEKCEAKLSDFEAVTGYRFETGHIVEKNNAVYVVEKHNKISASEVKELNEAFLSKLEQSGYKVKNDDSLFNKSLFDNMSAEDKATLGITKNVEHIVLDANVNARRISPKQELIANVKDNLYYQEYSYQSKTPDMDKVSMFCQWSNGILKDLTAEIGTASVAYAIATKTALAEQGFSEKTIDNFQKQMDKNGLSQNVIFNENISKESIIAKLEEGLIKEIKVIDKELCEIESKLKNLPPSDKEYSALHRRKKELEDKRLEVVTSTREAQDVIKKHKTATMSDEMKKLFGDNNSDKIINCLTTSEVFKGLDINFAKISASDLVKINERFLTNAIEKFGISFITPSGNFDIAKLQSLSLADLKKLGINPELRDMLVKVNQRGSFGRMSSRVGTITSAGMSAFMFLNRHGDGDSEIVETVDKIQKSVHYTTEAVKIVRKTGNIKIEDLKKIKSEGMSAVKNAYNRTPEKKPKATKRKSDKPIDKEKALNKSKKYAEKQQKKIKKIQKKQNGLRAKMSQAYRKAQEKVAKSLAGKLWAVVKKVLLVILKLVAIAGALVGVIGCCVIIVIFIVYFIISSLLNFNPQAIVSNLLAPDTYKEAVAYILFDELTTLEDEWLDSIASSKDLFENKESVKYGSAYRTYEAYIGEKTNLVIKDGKLYINPFHKNLLVSADTNPQYLTEVTKYDGDNIIDILTNANTYNNVYGRASIENGHTCNIKDIISMVDVMYNNSIQDCDDGSMEDVLGMSPAQINWNDFCEKVKNVFRKIGNAIFSLFSDEDEEPPFIEVNSVSYGTIQNYAYTLFECSHQQMVTLEVEYHTDTSRQMVTRDEMGNLITVADWHGSIAKLAGECSNPISKDFEIVYDTHTGRIRPCIDRNGTLYYIDDGQYETNITIDNMVDLDACQKSWFASNYETYNFIKNRATQDNSDCWQKVVSSSSVQASSLYTADTLSEAQAQAYMNRPYIDPSTTYTLYDTHKQFNYRTFSAGGYYEYWTSQVPDLDENGFMQYEPSGQPKFKTVYTARYIVGTITWEIYYNNCLGHNFDYCGGHIACHSSGIVYSATNEQLALTGVYDEGNAPVVKTFEQDKASLGYDSLRGKVNTDTLNLSNVVSFAGSGACNSPLADIQGSLSGMYGINIWIKDSSWSDDSAGMEEEGLYPQYMKDIFDIDCALKKGKRIFPLKSYKDYEGWSADNMQQALTKMVVDWTDIYGFDIPYEISGDKFLTPLSTEDINNIVEGIRGYHGSQLTTTREEAVRLALKWVNRGHYAEGHSTHAFLNGYCVGQHTITYADGTTRITKGNCTGGTDLDFANFIMRYTGRISTNKTSYATSVQANSTLSNAKPADIITHSEFTGTIEIPYEIYQLDELNMWIVSSAFEPYYMNTQTVIYLGKSNVDITLTTGQVIKANTPIIVDMQRDENYGGTIRIHGRSFDSWQYTNFHEDNYSWIDNVDARTSIYSYE